MLSDIKKIESVKADLLLINEITKPSKISQLQAPSNMQELHNLLKFKNTKSGRSKIQKQNAQTWLNKEGIDISPLVERVKKAKEVTVQKEELKKIEEDCLFYIPDMSHKKIDQYLIKAHDYGAMNVIQRTMKKSNLSKMIMNRVNSKFSQTAGLEKAKFKQRPLATISTIKVQTRDEQKRQRYLNCISAFGKRSIQRDELTYHISTTVNKKFWKIFQKHVKCLNEYRFSSQEQKMTYLYLDSLKQVQDQYDSYLASGSQSLNYYLTSNYLEKLEKRQQNYIRDREHKSFWGKAFILYRAGRRKDFYNLLSTRNQTEFMHDFNIADQNIDQKTPVKINATKYASKIGDVFRDQLIYTLASQAKYSSDVIADPTTLDFVWILLRNLGIFDGNQRQKFYVLKDKMFESYSKQTYLTQQMLYNYLYLLCYEDIAQIGLSEIMDQDDYIHFLICLNENIGLVGNKSQKIRKLLTKELMLYIRELINLGRQQYVYYMGLIPRQDRATQISNLLSSSNLITSFNWQYLRSCIPIKEQFEQIVKKTLQKHMLVTNNYITAAEKYIELLNDDQQAIKCLLQYLIKSFCNNSFTDHTVIDAESTCDRYLYRNPRLEAQFRTLLKFLIECRKLLQLLKDRKDNQIYNLVRNSDFVIMGSTLPPRHQQLFQNLITLSSLGLDIYFRYLKNVIKGLEIYCLRQNKNQELIQFITLVEENLDYIFSLDQFKTYRQRQEAVSLRELINNTHYEVGQY